MFATLRTLITRWFQPSPPTAEAESAGTLGWSPEYPRLGEQDYIAPCDENLLERARTQWQCGDWESLAKLEPHTLQHHPDRGELVLLAAAGRLQMGAHAEARQYLRLAQGWGESRKRIGQVLIAGVHNSLGRAAAVVGDPTRMEQHFRHAVADADSGQTEQASLGRRHVELHRLGLERAGWGITPVVLNSSSPTAISIQRSGLENGSPVRLIEDNGLTRTFETQFGKVTLYANETYITPVFNDGRYWDIDNLRTISKYIDPSKNILEIGGHCGTSSLMYASLLAKGSVVYVFEPQQHLFELLLHNVRQNGEEGKIVPVQSAVFCFDGELYMNDVDIDGGGGNPEKKIHIRIKHAL